MRDDRRWALVVGAGGYEFFNSLDYSVDDAIDFRDSLVQHLKFDSERVVLLEPLSEGLGGAWRIPGMDDITPIR